MGSSWIALLPPDKRVESKALLILDLLSMIVSTMYLKEFQNLVKQLRWSFCKNN